MSNSLPSACYRLQLREGVDFDRAGQLAPYLQRLGITHLYASPVFAAAGGSTHGYDVTDPSTVDPVLGGRSGLERLSGVLRDHDIGLILDIVPNHMAFSLETPWLRDVLRNGQGSRYANHFDIDEKESRLRLPWLTAPFETLLAQGAFAVEEDAEGPVLVTGGLRVPLAATPLLKDAKQGKADAIRALHSEQPWRLTHWRSERDAITHRRFFNVTSLIGLKVEDEEVFEDVHALLFDLVKSGIVQGVRVDHVDGLADPTAYLERLASRLGDVPVWVEKILSGSEDLPDWPVEGTTGYVAARAFARVLTDEPGLQEIEDSYRKATGRTDPFRDVLTRAKRQIITEDLAAELWSLHGMLAQIAGNDPVGVEYGPEMLRQAIVDFIAAFPRYRTYGTADRLSKEDARLIHETAEAAMASRPDPGALPFLAEVLSGTGKATAGFRIRFQQVTGAAIAKSQEDTAFYRDTRLLSANEVGGEPDEATIGVEGFHRSMERRLRTMPHGLTLTSSHDTKRSEDARMRIAAITHAPQVFARFHALCEAEADAGVSANLRWYLSQTLLAMDTGETDDEIAERLSLHVEKALREAKRLTFWTDPNIEVEDAAHAYVRRLVAIREKLRQTAAPILAIAERLSLAQVALKLTAPGIPDIYQGCEIGSYLLTDPDNRASIDFEKLARAIDDPGLLGSDFDRAKLSLTRTLLHLRRTHKALFERGTYSPRPAPPGQLSFERRLGELVLSVVLEVKPDTALSPLPEGDIIWPADDRESPIRIGLLS